MATLIASKSEILRESRKIKTSPGSHQIKSLTFKKKIHYKKFVDWVDSSDDTLKKVKLPSRREILNYDSNLGMLMGLSLAAFWKDIEKILEGIGFGNWKVGAGILGVGGLGLKAALSGKKFKGKKFNKGKVKPRGKVKVTRSGSTSKGKVKVTKGPNWLQRNISKIKSNKSVTKGSNFVSRNISKVKSKLKIPTSKVSTSGPGFLSKITPGFLKKPITGSGIKPRVGGLKTRVGGPLSALFAGLTLHDRKVNQNQSNVKAITGTVAETACGTALGAKGAAAGAAVGSVVPGAGTILGGVIGGLVGGSLGAMLCGAAADAIVDTVEGNQSNVIDGASQCVDCENQSSNPIKSPDKLIQPSEKIVSSDKLIKPSEKTVVISEKTQTEDGDTTIVLVPSQQQVLASQPVQQGEVIPFSVGGGRNGSTVIVSSSESEVLNNMWTNILLTKLATS